MINIRTKHYYQGRGKVFYIGDAGILDDAQTEYVDYNNHNTTRLNSPFRWCRFIFCSSTDLDISDRHRRSVVINVLILTSYR